MCGTKEAVERLRLNPPHLEHTTGGGGAPTPSPVQPHPSSPAPINTGCKEFGGEAGGGGGGCLYSRPDYDKDAQ